MLDVATSFSRVSNVALPSPAVTTKPSSSAASRADLKSVSSLYFVFSSTGVYEVMFAVLQASAKNTDATNPAMNRAFTTALLPPLGIGSHHRPRSGGVFHLH